MPVTTRPDGTVVDEHGNVFANMQAWRQALGNIHRQEREAYHALPLDQQVNQRLQTTLALSQAGMDDWTGGEPGAQPDHAYVAQRLRERGIPVSMARLSGGARAYRGAQQDMFANQGRPPGFTNGTSLQDFISQNINPIQTPGQTTTTTTPQPSPTPGGGGLLDGGLVGGGVAPPPITGETPTPVGGNIPTTDQGPFNTNNLLGHIFSPLYRDPSYDFRFNEGQRALEGAQNARGLYNSGATQRALVDYGQNMASTEFQNAFGRRQNTVNQALGITGVGEALRQGEFGRGVTLENLAEQLRQGQYGRQLGLAQLGMQAAGAMLGGSNPTIPGQPNTGQAPNFNPVQSQANFNINPWAQLMMGAAGSIGDAGTALGQGQAASSLAWQNAMQNIGNIFGSSGLFGGNTTQPNAWSIRR